MVKFGTTELKAFPVMHVNGKKFLNFAGIKSTTKYNNLSVCEK